MRAVYWKELRELAILGLFLLTGAALLAVSSRGRLEDFFRAALIAGLLAGVLQGVLDRGSRDDLFLLHRPLSALRLHFARTLAGTTVCLVAILGFIFLRAVLPAADPPWRASLILKPRHVPETVPTLLLLAATCASWSLFRLVLLPRRWVGVLALVLFFPFLVYAWMARIDTIAVAIVAGFVFCAACTTTALLQLAGEAP